MILLEQEIIFLGRLLRKPSGQLHMRPSVVQWESQKGRVNTAGTVVYATLPPTLGLKLRNPETATALGCCVQKMGTVTHWVPPPVCNQNHRPL